LFSAFTVCDAQEKSDLYRDESAAGARGAMGLFANGYSRAISANAFGLRPNSFSNRISSAILAAASYQVLSFDTQSGLAFKPLKFKKEWQGYWQGYLTAEGLDIFLSLLKKYNGMKFLFGSTFMAATGVMIIEGENRQTWRYAEDRPLTFGNLITNRNSYWVHFAGSGGLYWAISRHTKSKELALAYSAFLIWMWEIKDGYLWYEDVGFLGGDGFSWSDGLAGTMAAVGSYAVSKLFLSRSKQPDLNAHDRSKQAAKKTKMMFYIMPDRLETRMALRVRF
jgi:hypothetical protein